MCENFHVYKERPMKFSLLLLQLIFHGKLLRLLINHETFLPQNFSRMRYVTCVRVRFSGVAVATKFCIAIMACDETCLSRNSYCNITG